MPRGRLPVRTSHRGVTDGGARHREALLGRQVPQRTPEPPPTDGSGEIVSEIPKWVHIVAPSTLVPALAFYFGKTNVEATAAYFGVPLVCST